MTTALAAVPADTPVPSPAARQAGLDALRAALTLLVVWHHTALTYGAIGAWFYREVSPGDSWPSRLLVFFCTVNQSFFMGLFFLLAGYFTPTALSRKGGRRYLQDRFVRLGIPLLVFGWVLGPLTVALAETAQGRPFADTLMHLWAQGRFERGPLWFCQALLLFACGAVLSPRWMRVPRPMAFSNTTLLVGALFTGAAAFALRLWWPIGTHWWGLQLGHFASYVVLFAGGIAASRTRWLETLSSSQARTWRGVTWLTLPVLPVLALWAPPALQGPAEGGWNVLAAVYALWEPLVAWGLVLSLLRYFQRRPFDAPAWRALSDRAYTIFIIHPPVLVAVACAWRSVALHPLLKFAVTGSVSCWLCFVLAGAVLRIPGARRVL